MTAQHKLRVANTLMVFGIGPWIICLAWVAPVLLASGDPVPMLDPIAMIGVMAVTFAVAVFVGGLSALWSFSLTARDPKLRSREIVIVRAAVGIALCAPPLMLMRASAIG